MPIKVVQRTPELLRIARLPRRQVADVATDEAIDVLTEHYKTPRGTMRLLHVQAAGLIELYETGGWFGQAGVGQGKTLITLLAATVLGAKRPLLLVPAKLREKTEREIRKYQHHWKIHRPRVESYQALGRAGGGHMLSLKEEDGVVRGYCPDLLILDEAHYARNHRASVTKKIATYVKRQRAAGKTLWVLLCSGTMSKRELEDFAHFAEWTHPLACPLPRSRQERKLWGKAVNEGVPDHQRVQPGALRIFESDEGEEDLERIRRGLQKRIFETPGFLATRSNDVADCSLIIECHQIDVPPKVDKIFSRMKETYETPAGDELDSGARLYGVSRQLACGFYKRWDPQAPKWWLTPRKMYNKGVRHRLSHNQKGLSSPEDVRREIVAEGEKHKLWPVYEAWEKVRPRFKPRSVPVWIDDFAIRWVEKWAKENTGIIWVEWPDFGMRLAKVLGVPYYGEKGLDVGGRYIEDEDGKRCIVASSNANSEGLNLQAQFHQMLFTSAPPTGAKNEQLIGRVHRQYQKADEVIADYMIASIEQYNGFMQSMRDAGFHSEVLGTEMKLHEDGGKTADIILPKWRMHGGAWAEPTRE